MNSNTRFASRADLVARFRQYRRNVRFGACALVSLSTLRALSAVESRQAERLTRSIVASGRTDDSISDPDVAEIGEREENSGHAARAYALTPGERAAIAAARPGSRSLVWRAAPVAEADEPLPADFVPAPVADFVPALLSRDDPEVAALELAAQIEAGIEVAAINKWDRDCAAAVDFASDYADPAPVDYAPAVVRVAAPTSAPVAVAAPTEADQLLAAILGNAKRRRVTFHA